MHGGQILDEFAPCVQGMHLIYTWQIYRSTDCEVFTKITLLIICVRFLVMCAVLYMLESESTEGQRSYSEVRCIADKCTCQINGGRLLCLMSKAYCRSATNQYKHCTHCVPVCPMYVEECWNSLRINAHVTWIRNGFAPHVQGMLSICY